MTPGKKAKSVGLFILLLTVMECLYLLSNQSEAIFIFAKTTAQLTAIFLSVLGESVKVDGISLYSPLLNMRIVSECTAITPTMVFSAAVLAFPATLSVKLKGLLFGAVSLYMINLVRVVTLYYIGTYLPSHMEFVHIVIWQSIMVLIAIGLWSLWAARYSDLHRA